MGLFDWLPKIGAGGLAYLPGTEPKEPQSDIITRPIAKLVEKIVQPAQLNIPLSGSGNTHAEPRAVAIYSHPVLGIFGSIIEHALKPGQGGVYDLHPGKSLAPPDPRRHWAVLVGDVFHELFVDRNLNVTYETGRADMSTYKWEKFIVGWTKYDDVAIHHAGEEVIKKMRPVYDIYDNNCQKFTIDLLDVICEPGRQKVTTSYSYIHHTKMGIHIPFLSDTSDTHHEEDIEASDRQEALKNAVAIMDEHTPRVKMEDIGTFGVHHESGELVLVQRA